jgi:hypothetical protein
LGAAVASSCVGLRWRKKAWTWRIRPAMVGVGEFARSALSAPQIRSVGLSCGLSRAPCSTRSLGWAAGQRLTSLERWMMTLSQMTATTGAAG